jgi:glutamyl-tRNA reductase
MINLPESPYSLNRLASFTITHRMTNLEVIGHLNSYVDKVYRTLYPFVDGLVVLSTCNRFEVYIDNTRPDEAIKSLRDVLGKLYDIGRILRGVEAVRHLYEVASGLDSVIVGEWEILEQVKSAWNKARREAYSSRLLDYVFHGAIVTGLRVRRETGIAQDVEGYPEAAVKLALSKASKAERILIVGAGKAARGMVKTICSRLKPKAMIIASRRRERLQARQTSLFRKRAGHGY